MNIDNDNQGFNHNPQEIGKQFVNFYYPTVMTNPNNLIDSKGNCLFKHRTCYKIQGQEVIGTNDIISSLFNLLNRGVKYEVYNTDITADGNRRINILVTGRMSIDNLTYNFSEYFHIGCSNKDSDWFIQGAILRTF